MDIHRNHVQQGGNLMFQNETNQLLKECNLGIKMAIDTIGEVLPNIKDPSLRQKLSKCQQEHNKLGEEVHTLLITNQQSDEEPGTMAKAMAWMKTNIKMSVNPGDDTIADHIITGCDMGVRTLQKCLNQCKNASDRAIEITRQIIKLEETLSKDLRIYL